MNGKLHSIETFGAVDGPGIRLVVFVKGCPLRCQYCHNPDTWKMDGAKETSVDEILALYEKNRPFYANGGITVTGGEPMLQMEFVTELFTACKARGIHTCLDTSAGCYRPEDPDYVERVRKMLAVTDLVLLDIKHIDSAEHKKLTGMNNEHILAFARLLDETQTAMYVRHVIVPGITLVDHWLYQLGEFIGTLKMVKRIEVLPYHDMAKPKYKELGMDYVLKDVVPPSREQVDAAKAQIIRGIKATRNGGNHNEG
ncbi:MAG: pyruvate formate-lyase-activating protein [Clostridia bacterium]|nr:pyruvate formate-lyase-activating protein [Clostridia bacterium]